MNLSDFYREARSEQFSFTREQGSNFAKKIAGDFNPLHDEQAKKFCIPGDLLFSVALEKLGVSNKMHFSFSGMVSENIELRFVEAQTDEFTVQDANDKEYLKIERSGERLKNKGFANALAHSYVSFSGRTFPHLLLPLMAENNVMINPARPLVIYQSMSIDLLRLDFSAVTLEVIKTELTVDGKRGNISLQFCFKEGDEVVGYGEKVMILSGLRAYDKQVMDELVVDYIARKKAFRRA